MSYANGTSVSEDRSRQEIEALLIRFGGDDFEQFGYVTGRDAAEVGFRLKGLNFRIRVPMPELSDARYQKTPTGKARSQKQAFDQYLAERRRRWRSLSAVIKAKLIAIEDRVATFEDEFLPYLVTGSGQTVAEQMRPLLEHTVKTGEPLMLPAPDGGNHDRP